MAIISKGGASTTKQIEWLQHSCDHYDLAARSMLIGSFWPEYASEWEAAVRRLTALESVQQEKRFGQRKAAEKAYYTFLVEKEEAIARPKRQ